MASNEEDYQILKVKIVSIYKKSFKTICPKMQQNDIMTSLTSLLHVCR